MINIFRQLLEKGRKFSKANEAKLRKALESISDLLAQLDGGLTEAERSHRDKHSALQRALRASVTEYPYAYVADVFDSDVVYEQGGRYYRCSYTLDDAGNATFGDAVEVLPQVIYNQVGEPALTEAALTTDCAGPLIEADLTEASALVKLIQPGWGSSGYYPASTLKAAAGVFSKGLKMFWDHPTAAEEAQRPEGSLDRLAAELVEDAKYQEQGPQGPGLYARAKVFERFSSAVGDLKDHIGVSIRAAGMIRQGEAEGRKGPIVERIADARSVDFVTIPGAGGEIVSLFESAGRRPAAIIPTQESEMNEEQIKALVAAQVGPLQEAVAANKAENAELRTENQRLRETIALQGAGDFVRRKLATTEGLPQITKDRLAESLVSRATLKDGALDEAAFTAVIESQVKAEADYLAAAGVKPRIVGMGSGTGTEPKAIDEAGMTAAFTRLGLSEAAAKVAARG